MATVFSTAAIPAFATEAGLETEAAKHSGVEDTTDTGVLDANVSTEDCYVYTKIQSDYTVIIPKSIQLVTDGTLLDSGIGYKYSNSYYVSAYGDLAGDQSIIVEPVKTQPLATNESGRTYVDDSGKAVYDTTSKDLTAKVVMISNGMDPVAASINQEKHLFRAVGYSGTDYTTDGVLMAATKATVTDKNILTGSISAELTAGDWSGTFSFQITLDNAARDYVVGEGDDLAKFTLVDDEATELITFETGDDDVSTATITIDPTTEVRLGTTKYSIKGLSPKSVPTTVTEAGTNNKITVTKLVLGAGLTQFDVQALDNFKSEDESNTTLVVTYGNTDYTLNTSATTSGENNQYTSVADLATAVHNKVETDELTLPSVLAEEQAEQE
jgi:hypothetical protein